MSEIEVVKDLIRKSGLYLVQPEDYERVAEVAADAYRDYPLFNWLFGSRGYCPEAVKQTYMNVLNTMGEKGLVYSDSPEINGIALWWAPGFKGVSVAKYLAEDKMRSAKLGGLGYPFRLAKYERFAMDTRRKYTEYNDWYLGHFAISHKGQGTGIASKMLDPMLKYCSDNKQLCYLETNVDKNVSLYRYYGFCLGEKKELFNSDVFHYAFIRSPL